MGLARPGSRCGQAPQDDGGGGGKNGAYRGLNLPGGTDIARLPNLGGKSHL